VSVWTRKGVGVSGWTRQATLEGQEHEVKAVAFSPDPEQQQQQLLLASASRDKTVWFWALGAEGEDAECLSVGTAHGGDVKALAFAPDGQLLAFASYDDTVRLWAPAPDDGDDWQCVATLTGHTSTVWDVAWRPDGQRLASCSDDRAILIWALQGGSQWAPVQRLVETKRAVLAVHWASHSAAACRGWLAAGGADNALRLYAPSKGEGESLAMVAEQREAHQGDVNSVAWHPRLPLLATAGDDATVRLWTVKVRQ